MLHSISFASLGLVLLVTGPAAADIAPERPQCQTAGASCQTRGGQPGACVAVDDDFGPPLRCRVVAPPADPVQEPVQEPVVNPPADVPPVPEPEETPDDDDSFFSCAALAPGSGVTPVGSLALAAFAWAVFFLRRRRND